MTTDLADALAAAAADTGGRYDAAGLQELLEGVVAAPAALDDREWMELAVPGATEAQAKRLRAAKAAVAAARRLAGPKPAERLAALRGVLSGEAAMSPRLVARILGEFQAPKGRFSLRRPSAAVRLSAREWEVMSLLAAGKSTHDVAQQLFLSPTTIRVHVSSVMRKLHVKDRDSAFRLLRGE